MELKTTIEWPLLMVSILSLVATIGVSLAIKSGFHRYRRPNGKKGGFVSIHTALAFSIVTVVALTTKDWFLTGLAVLLAYLIAKGRIDADQHYFYQVILGAIMGITVPYGAFYIYNATRPERQSEHHEHHEHHHSDDHHGDDREKASEEAPELELSDIKD